MTPSLILCWTVALAKVLLPGPTSSQIAESQYTLHSVATEVDLTFHVSGAHGIPVQDLRRDEIKVFDNEVEQHRILSFQTRQDGAVRIGILIDTSNSMESVLSQNKAIAIQFVQQALRRKGDRAFVEEFGFAAKVTEPWTSTSDAGRLVSGIRSVVAGRENPLPGTALFDAIFNACFSDLSKISDPGGKALLLFTDGEDNSSHSTLEAAVDMCQQSNTAIYAFRPEPTSHLSSGPGSLTKLASETGGRVFNEDGPQPQRDKNLGMIEEDLRNQYFLSYIPSNLKYDGSFHRIVLLGPERADAITVRSGYYERQFLPAGNTENGFVL